MVCRAVLLDAGGTLWEAGRGLGGIKGVWHRVLSEMGFRVSEPTVSTAYDIVWSLFAHRFEAFETRGLPNPIEKVDKFWTEFDIAMMTHLDMISNHALLRSRLEAWMAKDALYPDTELVLAKLRKAGYSL